MNIEKLKKFIEVYEGEKDFDNHPDLLDILCRLTSVDPVSLQCCGNCIYSMSLNYGDYTELRCPADCKGESWAWDGMTSEDRWI